MHKSKAPRFMQRSPAMTNVQNLKVFIMFAIFLNKPDRTEQKIWLDIKKKIITSSLLSVI